MPATTPSDVATLTTAALRSVKSRQTLTMANMAVDEEASSALLATNRRQ